MTRDEMQARHDKLAILCGKGTITEEEKREYFDLRDTIWKLDNERIKEPKVTGVHSVEIGGSLFHGC